MFQGELKNAIFIGNDLYELLIIKLIYLNSGGVADKRRAKANRAATVDARSGILLPAEGRNSAFGTGSLSHLAKSVWQTDRVIARNGPQCGPLSLRGSPLSDTIHVAPEFIW